MTKKISIVVGSIILVVIAIVVFMIIKSNTAPDPLASLQTALERYADPSVYSDSVIEEFNHIDQTAESLHLKAKEFAEKNNLNQAIDLLNQAISEYIGFHGYHYFSIKLNLAILYTRQGDERSKLLFDEVEMGIKELQQQEPDITQ